MSCVIEPGIETIQLFSKSIRKTLRPYYTGPSMLSAAPVRCYLCLSSGHTKASCPLRYCKMCGGVYGHSSKECRGQRTWRSKSTTPPPVATQPPPLVHRREWTRGKEAPRCKEAVALAAAQPASTFKSFTHMSHLASRRSPVRQPAQRNRSYGFKHGLNRQPAHQPVHYAKGPSARIGDGFVSRRSKTSEPPGSR